MKAHILIIGDEILSGRINDTNGPWLGKWLFSQGIIVDGISIISDQLDIIKKNILKQIDCNDLLLITGGLGPTLDDLTKPALAEAFNLEMIESDESQNLVKKHYERFGREWTKDTNSYHLLPEKVSPLFNPLGLAPGLKYLHNEKIILCAPGVPHELYAMANEVFYPILKDLKNYPHKSMQQISIRTFGIPEERIFFELEPNLWETLSQFGKVSSLPQTMGVDVVITTDQVSAQDNIKKIIDESKLKPYVWQWGNLSLPELVLKKAQEKNITFSFAESCTGGLVSSLITDIPGSSSHFLGSVVSYANELKENILDVKSETLKTFGAVSVQTAQEMAQGALNNTKSNIAISFTGIAGPGGGSEEKPVGTVAIGLATSNKSLAEVFQYKGDREKLKRRFCERGLMTLLKAIEEF